MSSDTPSPDPVQDIQVRLKPLFGVEPKYYLAALYGLILLAVLFALTVLPGLTRPGTLVTVASVPPGAAVTYGGKHWGTTPLTVFLPEGKAPLEVSKPGFAPAVREYSSGNSLFLSLLFPRTDKVEVKLEPSSPEAVADRYRAEIGRWALAAPFSTKYPFPPLFTRFATDARASGWDDAKIRDFLLGLRQAVADPQMYQDYGRALGLWAADAPAPGDLKAQFGLWEPLVSGGTGRLAFWLLANQPLPVRDRESTDQSDWFKTQLAALQTAYKAVPPGASGSKAGAPASLKTALGSFRAVPASTFLWGSSGNSFSLPVTLPYDPLPVPASTPAFWIAEKEVTQAEFAAFTAAQPRWAPSARDALTAAGLADADYLAGWTDGKPAAPSEPVASVSWYAAQAYADWLNASGKVPAGKKAVLPDDFQWEAAARAPGGASMLNQGVWEWTASAWYPGQSFVWTSEGPADPQAYARSLKGGVQNAKGSVKASDRAGWPAAGATPGLGFRLALVGNP